MKKLIPLVQTKTGLIIFVAIVTVAGGATVLAGQAINQKNQAEQAVRNTELTSKLNELIIAGNFELPLIESSVESLVYNQDFKDYLIKTAGNSPNAISRYRKQLQASQQGIQKHSDKLKEVQQNLYNFVEEYQGFFKSLPQEKQDEVNQLLAFDIPSNIRGWQRKYHQQNVLRQCSPVTSAPICGP